MQRKVRKGEYTCNCVSYNFPHRFGGGRCSGFFVIEECWETNYGCNDPCKDCINLNQTEIINYCEVYEGQESIKCCPVWREFVEYNEIKL